MSKTTNTLIIKITRLVRRHLEKGDNVAEIIGALEVVKLNVTFSHQHAHVSLTETKPTKNKNN